MYATKAVNGVTAQLGKIDPHEVRDLQAKPESSPHVGSGFVSTRRGVLSVTNSDPETVRTSVPPISHERLSSSVTALVIEQVLARLGVHARLSDIVRGAQLVEMQSCNRVRAANRSIRAE